MSAPELYLLVTVGPTGLNWMSARVFASKPENLYAFTRGEGQALLFRLENCDCSAEFYEALQSGAFAADLGGRYFEFDLRKALGKAIDKEAQR